MKKTLTIAIILLPLMLNAQTIEKFSIDSGGDHVIVGNIDMLYTIGEVNVREVTVGDIQLSEGFINPEIQLEILLDPKMYLQGPFLNPAVTELMNDDLRNNGYIPTTSPYEDVANCDASVFDITGNDAIVDWIWVELRDAADSTIMLYGTSALLQRDGNVVSTDGVSNLSASLPEGDYFVVVDHRVHLPAMSATALTLTSGAANLVDFTQSTFPTYGDNAQVSLSSGVTALWTGDTNLSNQIRFSGSGNGGNIIKDYVLADPSNLFGLVTFSSSGYLNIDVDLNGIGRFSGSGNDRNILKDNVLAHPGNFFGLPTYTIQSTVPPKN